MRDNPQPRYSRMTGALATGGGFSGGRSGHLPDGCAECCCLLDYLPEIHSAVKIGDEVVVLGNAEGAGVVKPLDGKVVATGPPVGSRCSLRALATAAARSFMFRRER